MQKRLIVITGPTAVGKTALSVALAERIGGEIVSADSMQIYKGLDIGTAKATPDEKRGIVHYMLDVAEPSESFSVARYVDMASACIDDIFARGKCPILVGGTGLYIDSLLSGRDFAPSEDAALRAELSAQYDAIGGEAFREKLSQHDSERAQKLHPSDKKRLVRAMEVFTLTGETISQHDLRTKSLPPRYDSLRFALSFAEREALYKRIDARVDAMIAAGLFDEIRNLLADGLSENSTAMQAIGYKQAMPFLRGETSAQEAAEEIKLASRRYAKRQLTWLRRDADLHWILWQSTPDLSHAIAQILSYISA